MKPRFLLDENVKHVIQHELRRLNPEIEVYCIGNKEVPSRGTPDPAILVWIEENQYILVTENRSTMPVHLAAHFAAGRHHPGILWIRPNTSIGQLVFELYMIWLASEAEEYYDKTDFLPL